MLEAIAGSEFVAVVSGFPTGLTGTAAVQLLTPIGGVIIARTTEGINEVPAGSGTYVTVMVAPSTVGGYLVFWDQGTITPETTFGEPLEVSASAPPVTDPKLLWLRRMVNDIARTEAEMIIAPGGGNEFFVANPPIVETPLVALNNVSQTTPAQFSYTPYSVIFVTAPEVGSSVTIRYARTTFSDTVLEGYLQAAAYEYTAPQHLVYRAAIYVVDTLLAGAATALDFGSGQENFQMSSVFNRLTQLRNLWEQWLENNVEEARIVIGDMVFDTLDPTFPATFDPNQLDYSTQTITGSPPGYPRAIDP
jgi:hypothetical protein